MSMDSRFVIRGCRGSASVCGARFLRHGGSTTCFTLETQEGWLIVDAGTGIANVDAALAALPRTPSLTLLFTHFHLDHLAGLPSLHALYRKSGRIRILAHPSAGDWRGCLARLFRPPYWPVPIFESGASFSLEDLPANGGTVEAAGVRIGWTPLRHPQGCMAYRLATPRRHVVVATDHEHGDPEIDRSLVRFAEGADVLIYDAQYTPVEYERHRGWGHDTWEQGVACARAAGVRELILTHIERHRTDEEQDAILRLARAAFPSTRSAAENMVIPL